jgi:hypothetical protein
LIDIGFITAFDLPIALLCDGKTWLPRGKERNVKGFADFVEIKGKSDHITFH